MPIKAVAAAVLQTLLALERRTGAALRVRDPPAPLLSSSVKRREEEGGSGRGQRDAQRSGRPRSCLPVGASFLSLFCCEGWWGCFGFFFTILLCMLHCVFQLTALLKTPGYGHTVRYISSKKCQSSSHAGTCFGS